jgi:hemoglobin-like flavoprotein
MNRTDQARAIEQSLELAAEHGGDLTPRVYTLLFARQPAMEALFWRDGKKNTIKGEMLARVFETILDFVGERRYSNILVHSEMVTHEGYDVPRDVFPTFFSIVAEVLKDACGADWTDDMERAWRQTIAEIEQYARGTVAAPA